MQKPKFNPSYPTLPILILIVSSGLCLLAIGISTISTVSEDLASGRTYSLGIMLDYKAVIYRSSSPEEYWVMMCLYSIGVAAMVGFGIWMPIVVIIAYIKKLARQKKYNEEGRK
jgi:hypothetical protein